MIALDTNEAILFRLLTSFFGQDKVIPQMSVLAACGGELPEDKFGAEDAQTLTLWAKKQKCLFTVVNELDNPRLVVELSVDAKSSIDVGELDKQQRARPLLGALGIPYIVLTKKELTFVCDPAGPDNWFHLLSSKFEEAAEDLVS